MNRRSFGKGLLQASVVSALAGPRTWAAAPLVPTPHEAGLPTFSVMLWTLPKSLSFEQQLQVVHDAGYGSVEVLNEYEHWTPEKWRRNLAKLHALGLTVDSAVPGRNTLADSTQRKALRDDLKRAIPGAKDLGCSQFIYTAYNRVPGQTPEQQRAAIVDTLKFAADMLERDGFELVLEPIDLLEHKEEAVTSVVEAAAITRAVGSPRVKVLYDFFHEQRQAGNLIESLEKNIEQVGLVHIADSPSRHRPGTGEINYTNIYRKLAELKYRRTICMEFLPVGDPVEELRNARLEAVRAMNDVHR